MTQLFDSTLAADAATIDTGANGVPQTANHLLIFLLLRGTQAATTANINMTLNNDAAAHYDRVNVSGNSGGASGSSGTAESGIVIVAPGASVTAAALFGVVQVFIPCYTQTVADKHVFPLAGFADTNGANGLVQLRPTHFQSTAAISRIAITPAANNLKAGSRMTIYGLL